LAYTLARDVKNDPDLTRLIEAWSEVPAAIRAGIVAMVDAVRKGIW
jgi:hypothetical protein